jgi:hypothetical protein
MRIGFGEAEQVSTEFRTLAASAASQQAAASRASGALTSGAKGALS